MTLDAEPVDTARCWAEPKETDAYELSICKARVG
jgi:hypothetical protein